MRADEPKSAKQFFIVSPFGRSFSPAFLSVLGYVAGRGGMGSKDAESECIALLLEGQLPVLHY